MKAAVVEVEAVSEVEIAHADMAAVAESTAADVASSCESPA